MCLRFEMRGHQSYMTNIQGFPLQYEKVFSLIADLRKTYLLVEFYTEMDKIRYMARFCCYLKRYYTNLRDFHF